MKIERFNEKRNFKPYLQYCDFIKAKFEVQYSFDLEFVKMFEEDGDLFVTIKTWDGFSKKYLDKLNDYFKNTDYYISPANGSQLIIELRNIQKDVLDKIIFEMETNKYNL